MQNPRKRSRFSSARAPSSRALLPSVPAGVIADVVRAGLIAGNPRFKPISLTREELRNRTVHVPSQLERRRVEARLNEYYKKIQEDKEDLIFILTGKETGSFNIKKFSKLLSKSEKKNDNASDSETSDESSDDRDLSDKDDLNEEQKMYEAMRENKNRKRREAFDQKRMERMKNVFNT